MTRPAATKPSENPFRSACLDELPYLPTEGWRVIERRLRDARFRGAVVGPHGHGKTTLIEHLADQVSLAPAMPEGSTVEVVCYIRVDPSDRSQRHQIRRVIRHQPGLLVIDGYDLLGWWDRLRVRMRRRPVLVTSHRETPLATVARCRTSPELLADLIERLSPPARAALGRAEITRLYEGHRGNLRDALRELYDRVADGDLVTAASSA
ncbi:MAG: hypothetical protein AAF333_08970 [Planctomycetota bacterium]